MYDICIYEGDFSESDLELPAKPRAQRFKSSTTSG